MARDRDAASPVGLVSARPPRAAVAYLDEHLASAQASGDRNRWLDWLHGMLDRVRDDLTDTEHDLAGGISIDKLDSDPVTVRLRRGGERLQPDARRPRRSLKNLLQEARIPSHERDRLPLLFSGNALVFVPGIGIDAAFHARSGERAIAPVWQAD